MQAKIKIRFFDIFISSIISLFFTIKIYDFLYSKIGYSNLSDFYAGVSIYNNHNKFLDIWIYFIYLILFSLFYFCIYIISTRIIKSENYTSTDYKFIKKTTNFLLQFRKWQYLSVIGFILLYPFDGNLYPKLIGLIIILIAVSLIAIHKCKKGFSIFALTAILFIFCFSGYSTEIAPADDHHFGEKFTGFLMHSKFNLEYYKDIMLVHGREDITSAMLGAFFFDKNNIEGYCLGESLHRNIILIITLFSSLIIFSKNILYIIPVMLLNIPSASVMFVSVYLALIKENFLKNKVLWFWLYFCIAIIFASYWTTFGSFWIIASMPAFIYIVYKLPNRKLHLKTAFIMLFLLSIIFRNSFFEYINQAKYYIQGNLYAFGNDFINIESKMPIQIAFEWFYKMFALFFIPIIIIEIVNNIKIQKLNKIFFLIFSLILVCVSLPYTMGRLDNGHFLRLEFISFPFLCVVFPYWLYKFTNKGNRVRFKKLSVFVFIIFILYSVFSLLPKKFHTSKYISNTKLFNVGNIKLNENQEKRLTKIKEYIYSNGENKTFLDLTNRGMHYLYFNKKLPVQFTSFYNSIASKQAELSVEKIRKNPPDYILVYSNNILHDNVFPSIRINALYRWIFLKQKYEYKKIDENVFLVKTNKESNYTKEQLYDLDYYFGAQNLKFLPEVWAFSIKTLPIAEIIENYSVEIYGNEIKIIFFEPQKIKNLDLLLLDINKSSSFNISINNSDSKIQCKSKSGKILIPLDNFPSWLLNEKLKEISIETSAIVKTADVKFYKRKNY